MTDALTSSGWHVNMLLSLGDREIRVIHLVRDPLDSVASFKRFGYSFLHGVVNWIASNLAMTLYLRKAGVPYVPVSYTDLYRAGGAVLPD